jgi:type I restriction enzyme, S subunit
MSKAQLPKNWEWQSIGSLCELVNGRAFKPSDWGKTGLPIIRIQNLNDPSKPFNYFSGAVDDKHIINDGDILLSWSGTPGTSFGCFIWDRGKAVLNQHIFKVKVDPKACDPAYFTFAINDALDEMIDQAHGGVGLRHITKGKLESIELPVAPLDEQRRIVGRIKECLSRVDEIKRLREETQQEAEAIFTSALSGLVSTDWPSKTLGSLAVDIRNGWPGKETTAGVRAKVLRLSSVHSRTIDPSESKEVLVSESARQDFQVVKGDLFIVRGNGSKRLVGRSAMAAETYDDIIFSDLLIRVRFNSEALPKFVHYVLHSPFLRRQIEDKAKTAAGIWKVNQTHLSGLEIPCPAIPQQTAFIEKVEQTAEVCGQLLTEINSKEIELISQAVLRKAFAGEL